MMKAFQDRNYKTKILDIQLKRYSVHHQSILREGNIIYYAKFVLNSIKV